MNCLSSLARKFNYLNENRGAMANFVRCEMRYFERFLQHSELKKIQIDEKLEVNLHCFYFSNDEE